MVEALKDYIGPDDPGKFQGEWNIHVNRYQRDNLVWLFAVMGYGSPPNKPEEHGFWPFTRAQNGDWAGEIPQKLCKPKQHVKFGMTGTYTLDENDTPNAKSVSAFREDVERDLTFRLHAVLTPEVAWSVAAVECNEDGHRAMAKAILDGDLTEYKAHRDRERKGG